ncbi:MAG: xanthine dehydrogenase family protein [Myxococcales bacterium]|nr:xanthine dehydrogenase family protein [Myxococcales bacterium]
MVHSSKSGEEVTAKGSVSQSSVGKGLPRVDGDAKVRGTARYVDDLKLPNMHHGMTKRSAVPHGILKGIHKRDGFDWSQVVVVTAEDIPGRNTIVLIEEDQPALVAIGAPIRHHDEAVALVAAPSRELAHEALTHLELEVEEMPAVFTCEDALEAKVKVYGDDNILKTYLIEKGEGDIDAKLAACDHVIEGLYRTQAQEQMYIEPQGMIASWDEGRCHIVGSMQCPFYIQKAMCTLLGLDAEHLVVEQAVTGGGFGGKEEYPSMIAGHAALLAREAGVPVKLIYERDEDIAATTKRHPSVVRHRMGFDADGTIRAIDVDVLFDGGAYQTLTQVVLSRGVLHAAGPYKCENTRVRGRAAATNTPPHGAFRGFGAPQTTFAYERQTQKAAKLLGMSPFAFRELNMLRDGDSTATSQILEGSVGSEAVLSAVKEVAEAYALPADDENSSVRHGRGISFYFHGAGFTGSGEARLAGRATVALAVDGHFEVRSSSTDIGQGVQTMFTQIAATALGVEPDVVRVPSPATDRVPDSGPTVASRTCMVVGRVVNQASTALRERIEAWARENGFGDMPLRQAATAMAKVEGEIAETVQYAPPAGIVWDDEMYTGSAYPCYGWAACMVDVKVDLDTYEVTIDRCVHAVDVGKAINPVVVKGQIEGGTLQSLGWALWEDVIYHDGKVANDRMTNCIVPTFSDAPEMHTIIVEEPFASGPYGAKGVGEIPMDGPCVAAVGAVEDALSSLARSEGFDVLPVSPEAIQRAMRLES